MLRSFKKIKIKGTSKMGLLEEQVFATTPFAVIPTLQQCPFKKKLPIWPKSERLSETRASAKGTGNPRRIGTVQ
jgi:hypothetical protein